GDPDSSRASWVLERKGSVNEAALARVKPGRRVKSERPHVRGRATRHDGDLAHKPRGSAITATPTDGNAYFPSWGASSGCPRTTSTDCLAWFTTLAAVVPSSRSSPEYPWEPMTIMSAFCSSAAVQMPCQG